MRYWFVPCQSGDFRLQAVVDAAKCLLTVENPTEEDRRRLRPFLLDLRARGWLASEVRFGDAEKTALEIHAPLADVGVLLSHQVFPDEASWTAVRWSDGRVNLADEASAALASRIGNEVLSFTAGVGKWTTPTPIAAVTTPPPKLGCPEPSVCDRRPFQVLAAFSTETQITSFAHRGFLDAYGNVSGGRYRVFHRDAAARLGLRRTITNDQGNPVCAWLRGVPPEEEVLALKLAVENRESILLSDMVQPRAFRGLA